MTEWFNKLLTLPPVVAAAVVAAVISSATTILALALKSWYDTRHYSRKLELNYRFEQQKKLRDHLGQGKGKLLEACETLNHRIWNFYGNVDRGWLTLGDAYVGSVGYYARSFAYRLMYVFSLSHKVETEALYIDVTVAQPFDFVFLKALKLYVQVWTDVNLFEGFEYDTSRATDHFFKDQLRVMCDAFITDKGVISPSHFESQLRKEHEFKACLAFLDGMRFGEKRLRSDRLVAAHLILMTFLNRFGYDFQHTDRDQLLCVAHRCKRQVLENLKLMVQRIHLHEDSEFHKLLKIIDKTRYRKA